MNTTTCMRTGTAVLALFLSGSVPLGAQPRRAAEPTAAELSASFEQIVQAASPAVVQILATSYATGSSLVAASSELITVQRASGSGVIVDPAGFIVTNAHVVRGAARVRVELPGKPGGGSILGPSRRTVVAEIVGIDQETDLAVIKVAERDLPVLAFGDSDQLKAGQVVLAFGSPLGLNNSVSMGVISAVARQLEPESPMIYVQTDAPINPGSSGGPLVDGRGALVGINTMKAGTDGVGFAAPSNIVRAVFDQIRAHGRVRRGELGVRAQSITPVLAAGLGLPREQGVILSDVVPGGPAARAGLRVGDLVVALDGKPMENGRQFHVNLYRLLAGDVATVDVLRDGAIVRTPIAMVERRDSWGELARVADPRDHQVPVLGIVGVTLDEAVSRALPSLRTPRGVIVVSTAAGALESREGGLAPGDVIYAVNRAPVASLDDLRASLGKLATGDPVVLHLERGGGLLFLSFTLE